MTREEILNTPKIVDFMIDKSVMVDSKMKLHNRLDELCKLAIKALEQEPRKDEVILTKKEYGELVSSEFDNGYAKGYREALEQEPDWIPVSERLPEDRKEKLVYLSSNRITIAKYSSRIIPLAPYKSMGWGYEPKHHFIDFETEEVIAWMQLPEPYKAESEEE